MVKIQKNSDFGLSEGKIQQLCFIYYQNTYCLKFHFPRCLIFSVPNTKSLKYYLVGMLAGVSDLVVLHKKRADEPFRLIFIEVKSEVGKLSAKQIKFQMRVREIGAEYYAVKTLEDFQDIFRKK